MRIYLDRVNGWDIPGNLMTFYCIKCSNPLTNTGLVNRFICDKCKCIYEVKIELREIANEDIGKLPAAGDSEKDT
jgi:hypothetical protein